MKVLLSEDNRVVIELFEWLGQRIARGADELNMSISKCESPDGVTRCAMPRPVEWRWVVRWHLGIPAIPLEEQPALGPIPPSDPRAIEW
jgi:hypothetical protein